MTTTERKLRKEWVLIVIVILPFILIAIFWDTIPARIPLHWNIRGEVNRWGDKMSVFELPVINAGISILLYYLPRIDPRKQNYELFPRAYRMVRLALATFFFGLFVLTISPALSLEVNINSFIFIAIPLLFLVVGNFLRSFRQNFFAGIRTPWTLNNPDVWDRTHKLASWIWTGGSLAVILVRIIVGDSAYFVYVFVGYLACIIVIPTVMSYVYHRQLQTKE